jgi:hypothetical protein
LDCCVRGGKKVRRRPVVITGCGSSKIVFIVKYCDGVEIKGDEMGEACNTHGREF